MAKIFIDDKEYEVDGSKNLLEVCLSLGLNLTYFCWHPALHSVGACRQCAVIQYKDENDTKGKLIMACMQPVSDNMRVSIDANMAHDFRAGNIEALMINHPHDCPVCDEGGECHLQDMTVMSGHNYRRYRFNKRTHLNQYLGPFINHEMNRCIQCYRCVRFYKDYAGGKDLDVFAAHDDVYFGRSSEGVLENEFSGNLVEVCPTGVFTDKTLKQHYTRKWDLTNAPSICHQCGVGCNILAGERYGSIRRILSRYNGDVNGYFICDRGRFGYEYVRSEKRISHCSKGNQPNVPDQSANILSQLKAHLKDNPKLLGIGSPLASMESNFVLKKWVGENNFFGGLSQKDGGLIKKVINILHNGYVHTPSLKEAEQYDAVFILGEDITNTAPMLALTIRQTAKNKPRKEALDMKIPAWNDAATREVVQDAKGPVFVADTHATKIEEIAVDAIHAHPNELAEFGMGIAAQISDGINAPDSLNKEMADKAGVIGKALMEAKKPLIVSGTSLMSENIIDSAANIAYALKDAGKEVGLVYTVPEANSIGMNLLCDRFLEDAAHSSELKDTTLVLLENDLYRRMPEAWVNDFFEKFQKVIVLDNLQNLSTVKADYLLPSGTFAESDGTNINNEGRAQRFYQVHMPHNEVRSSWQWLDMLARGEETARIFDDIVAQMCDEVSILEKIKHLAPTAEYRIGTQKIPRATHRFSGRTAMHANKNVNEPKPPVDVDAPLSYTMEGYHGVPPAPDTPFYWSPGWNSVQAINKYQIEVGGPLHGGNPGIRLFEQSANENPGFVDIRGGSPSKEELAVYPVYHIYGSDPLSAQSPAVKERMPQEYIALSAKDSDKWGLKQGDTANFIIADKELHLPVAVFNSLPEGLALLPKGIGSAPSSGFPFSINIKTGK